MSNKFRWVLIFSAAFLSLMFNLFGPDIHSSAEAAPSLFSDIFGSLKIFFLCCGLLAPIIVGKFTNPSNLFVFAGGLYIGAMATMGLTNMLSVSSNSWIPTLIAIGCFIIWIFRVMPLVKNIRNAQLKSS